LGDQAMARATYEAALDTRRRLQAAYAGYFADNRLDAMLFPTAIMPARPIGDDETVELNGARVPTFLTFIRNTDPGSNAGIPGISLPAGLSDSGLPIGLELDAPAGSDRRLLAIAAAVEALLPRTPAPTL
jgi:Asp-tRNA(Asn)/Glu-tRNA(Gln) amidotransferase A subunit family amidase